MMNKNELISQLLKEIVYACVNELNDSGDISVQTLLNRIDTIARMEVVNYKGVIIAERDSNKPLTLLINYVVNNEIGILPVELNLYVNFGD